MKSAARRKKQAESDNEPEREPKERAGLTIAEKTNAQYFATETAHRWVEPELLVSEIRSIIGDNQLIPSRVPTRPSDNLARLLANFRFDEDSKLSEKSNLSLDEAIECCFLYSEAYLLALEIFRMDQAGQMVGYSTAYDCMQDALNIAKGGK
jgi:hypothetical protein